MPRFSAGLCASPECAIAAREPAPRAAWKKLLRLFISVSCSRNKVFKISAEKSHHVVMNSLMRYGAAVFGEQLVSVGKDRRHGTTRIAPFINHLFQYARVGVLRDKTHSEHLNPLPCDLFDNGGIIQEPPAAKGHQVTEFTCIDT